MRTTTRAGWARYRVTGVAVSDLARERVDRVVEAPTHYPEHERQRYAIALVSGEQVTEGKLLLSAVATAQP